MASKKGGRIDENQKIPVVPASRTERSYPARGTKERSIAKLADSDDSLAALQKQLGQCIRL